MRRAAALLLLVSPFLAASPAAALSCAPTQEPVSFRVHDLASGDTLFQARVEKETWGSMCGIGNVSALSGDTFAWIEPGQDRSEPPAEDPPAPTLHVADLPTGEVRVFTLPAANAFRLSVAEPYVLVLQRAVDGPSRLTVVDLRTGAVHPAVDDPSDGRGVLHGRTLSWAEDRDDAVVVRHVDPIDPSLSTSTTIPGLAGTAVRAASDRWLVLEARAQASDGPSPFQAYARNDGTLRPLSLGEGGRMSPAAVMLSLDGDTLYYEDGSGFSHMGRGRLFTVALPEGAPEPFERPASGGEIVDHLVADRGRIVLRAVGNVEVQRPERLAAEPTPLPTPTPTPHREDAPERRTVAAPGAVAALVVAAAALRSWPSRR